MQCAMFFVSEGVDLGGLWEGEGKGRGLRGEGD